MAKGLEVTIRYQGRAFYAAPEPGARGDELLLKSLYHFGIDPAEKGSWRLRYRDEDRPRHGIQLDHAIGEQVRPGTELVLEADVPGNRRLATGNY